MKIVIDRDIPYIRGVLEPYAGVVCLGGGEIGSADVADADALVVRTRTRCDRALLEGSRVRMIATATIGYDHIDIEYCRRAGIDVVTAAGSNARGVLQWMAAALAHLSAVQGWRPEEKTLGVVGVGNVGSLVARYAADWGFTVLCCDPPRERAGDCGCTADAGLYRPDMFVPFERITSECDIITFHTPLTRSGPDATYHMAGGGFFDAINPGTTVIDTARGEVVDTRAMLAAVRSGRCGCCIDTWESEPQIDRGLLEEALLSTPHIAGYTAQGKANASSMSVRALARRFDLPLGEWYPAEVSPSEPRPISWDEMTATITGYCDIAAESRELKENPAKFEELRNRYRYRTEYF